MSKKARRELDAQRREMWDFSPVTRKVESKKVYNRRKASHDRFDGSMRGFVYEVYKRAQARRRATATSFTLVPVGPVKIRPSVFMSAW